MVIGSGATAVTLIPSLADSGAGHVTMLQRTPTFIVPQPLTDPISYRMLQTLPDKARQQGWSAAATSRSPSASTSSAGPGPRRPARLIRAMSERRLPKDVSYDEHFTPPYDPWDQRLCVVPRGDLFKALRKHTVDMVTDRISRFTEKGILLESGREPGGGHRHHRDRPQPAGLRRRPARRGRRRGQARPTPWPTRA
ncbi:hypothetical protein [Nocardioides convexus]|uniref:hypothetical protein n=1 Tax=Nocardioides convexus TaxID=2712224 RepID=UPI00241865B3|nr:hypothetical protein [Nocardioides convexus]